MNGFFQARRAQLGSSTGRLHHSGEPYFVSHDHSLKSGARGWGLEASKPFSSP
ncbi:hypothetical protein GPEL0_01r5410 [Geoanaerobacter pelophilus]|uniref:Uncharacterized protein n=1 Tax=Geoanaerobacter pelophilus TaxID=60036 RepID=A0ABQ0MP66_9BACT|nr:hypothetical protein GPEL0_01r5410 [Geoanaerobacter pelophilus]